MMHWTDFPWGALISFGALVLTVALLAMDERNRRKFVTRDEVRGMSTRHDEKDAEIDRKVERNTGLFVALDDRVGDLEKTTSLLEERQSNNWASIAKQMADTAETIRDVTSELKDLSKAQHEYALRLERLHGKGE